MAVENKRGNVPVPADSGNAILLDKKFVDRLMSAISKGASSIDKMPSKRSVIDFVVSKTTSAYGGNFIYYSGTRDMSDSYKYFGSEISTWVSSNDEIKDKGRFVEACIITYLFGERGMESMCKSSKEIRPRDYDQQKRAGIARKAAEIADAKDVVSGFVPTTHQE